MIDIKVLYVEDEAPLAEIVKESLEAKGFIVHHASTGLQAFDLYLELAPHIILLDVMLPDTEGYRLARSIRLKDRQTPILFLTSKSEAQNVVDGFESGGNDYLKKPFRIEELIIRMKALLSTDRLVQPAGDLVSLLPVGSYLFDPAKNLLHFKDRARTLTSRESEILKFLYINKNRLVARKKLLETMWGNNDFFTGRSLDVFITKLRKYLSDDSSVQIINVRGIGYKLVFDVETR